MAGKAGDRRLTKNDQREGMETAEPVHPGADNP